MRECPLVLCLTNAVAASFTANCLLAIGARPAMIDEPREAEELARVADSMLVNLGTVTARQAESMRRAVAAANAHGIPWALDPVGVQFLSYRAELAREFIAQKPSVIRCNAAESAAIGETGCVTLVTGEVDRVGEREIRGGVPILQSVTATGCAQGGLCAAFLGRGQAPRDAALSASRLMKRAGELAWERAKAPGSFQVALVDALWELSHD